jgi:hypothetical protein
MVKHCLLLLLTVVLVSCGNLLSFDVRVPIPEQTIPASAVSALGSLLPVDILPAVPVSITESRDFRRQDVGNLRSIKLKALKLTITEGSDQRNFDFLDSLQIDAETKDGKHRTHVAGLTTVPKGTGVLNLEVSGNELFDIVGTDFNLVFAATGRFPAKEAKFNGQSTFEVEADPRTIFP